MEQDKQDLQDLPDYLESKHLVNPANLVHPVPRMSSRIITVPNLLTVFRMVLIPVFVSLLFYQRFALALGIFILAGITDGLDGLLARRFNQKSQLGTILDPIADKLMLVTSFVVLSMRAVFPQPLPSHLPVPFWVTIAVISRDVFILVGAAAINVVTGFRGFRPSLLGKINTTVQIFAIAAIYGSGNGFAVAHAR